MSSNGSITRGYGAALASAAVLSTTAVFIRYLTQTYHLPPLVLALWRNIFTVATLSLVLRLRWPHLLYVKRQHLTYLIAYGLVLAAFNSMWTLSVALNGAAVATVLVYCSAAFTAILGWLLLKERLGVVKLVVVMASLLGCFFVSGASSSGVWGSNVEGIVIGVLSGLSYAGYGLMGRSASQRGLNPWTTLLYSFSFAGVFLFAVNLLPLPLPGAATNITELFWLGGSISGWMILFLLAAGPTVIGFGLYNVSLSFLPASVVNLVATLEPVFTAAIAYALLDELLSTTQMYGGLIIIAAVLSLRLLSLRTEKKERCMSGM